MPPQTNPLTPNLPVGLPTWVDGQQAPADDVPLRTTSSTRATLRIHPTLITPPEHILLQVDGQHAPADGVPLQTTSSTRATLRIRPTLITPPEHILLQVDGQRLLAYGMSPVNVPFSLLLHEHGRR